MASAIPVIDIHNPCLSEDQIARELVDAAVEHGFVYIRNKGTEIPPSDVHAAFDLSRTLFASPAGVKQKCAIQTNNRGWSGMHSETLDPKNQRIGDFKEAFNFGPFPNGEPAQPIPSTINHLVPQIASFRSKCHAMCLKLLHLFGLGLDVNPPSFFADSHDPAQKSGTILRHLYYPPVPPCVVESAEKGDIRAGAHSDYGSVTLLFRLKGQPGLEVLTREGKWVPVPVVPAGTEDDAAPPILVNIGDLLSYWTGGMLRSTVHRVVFPATAASSGATGNGSATMRSVIPEETDRGERYSIAFFCHPAGDTMLTAVPSERVRKFVEDRELGVAEGEGQLRNPYAERSVMTADEHLQMRLRASYLSLYKDDA